MKKELPYYKIDGFFGGSQDWFRDPWMRLGGCGAATACDFCIDQALNYGQKKMYPGNVKQLNKENYIQYASYMKPYLRPRYEGIKRLSTWMEGFERYLKEMDVHNIAMKALEGDCQVSEVREAVKKQIDDGYAIPCLMLHHKDKIYKDFNWHWFMLVGYEEYAQQLGQQDEGAFFIKVATYGHEFWFPIADFWKTGYKEKGGMVLIRREKQ